MWKRDLSRYYLQLPLCPVEYHLTGAIWRCCYFFFVALMFGLRHSGLNGQRVTDAVSWIVRNLGLEYVTPDQHKNSPTTTRQEPSTHPALATQLDPDREQPFNCMNYSDDFSGCESSLHRAEAAFLVLGNLLTELGLQESVEKACSPAPSMVFLGIQ